MNNEFIDSYGEIVGTHAVAVYSVLCRHANNDTQKCFPSMETIGRKAGIKSRKTVSGAIMALESLNIIKVEKATGADGKRLNNIYRLTKPTSWKGYQARAAEPVAAEEAAVEKKIKEVVQAILPDWMDAQVWSEWETYRRQKKQKLTPLSIKKQIAFLEQHKADYKDIIQRSITNGWTGLFPLRKDYQKPQVAKDPAKEGKYAHLSS